MKYLLLTTGPGYFPELMRDVERAGLYNWRKAYNGEVRFWQDVKNRPTDLLDYDIIHVNLAGEDMGLATKVRPLIEGSRVKLIVNMDYAINYFSSSLEKAGSDPLALQKDLQSADMVFGVEPTQVSLLTYFLTILKRPPAKLIPHPIDTEMMYREFFVDYDRRLDIMAYQYHRYDDMWEIPRMLMQDLPPYHERPVLTSCLGFMRDEFKRLIMPDIIMPYRDWQTYMQLLKACRWGFEYRMHYAASRFILECASIGIPVVSTNFSYMGRLLFPDLTFHPGDFDSIRKCMQNLILNEELYRKQAKRGIESVEMFNLENSRKRMEDALKNAV